MGVQNFLQFRVYLLPFRQQFIEFSLTADTPQSGLRQLGHGIGIVFHLNDGLDGIDHPEINHRIDLDRDIVPGDDVLGIYIHRYQAQAHFYHFIDHRYQDDQTRPLGFDYPTQAKNDPPFIFV